MEEQKAPIECTTYFMYLEKDVELHAKYAEAIVKNQEIELPEDFLTMEKPENIEDYFTVLVAEVASKDIYDHFATNGFDLEIPTDREVAFVLVKYTGDENGDPMLFGVSDKKEKIDEFVSELGNAVHNLIPTHDAISEDDVNE